MKNKLKEIGFSVAEDGQLRKSEAIQVTSLRASQANGIFLQSLFQRIWTESGILKKLRPFLMKKMA